MLSATVFYFCAHFGGKRGGVGDVISISPDAKGRMFDFARRLFHRFRRAILQKDNFNRARHDLSRNVYE